MASRAQDFGTREYIESRQCLTIGFLQGGGSLIGIDFETLVSDQVGLQIGGGFIGFGGGLNFHFNPGIRSSFLSLNYWHQGVNQTYTQSLVGGTFVFRAKKLLSLQLGLGFPLEQGPAWPRDMEVPPIMLLYSAGLYFPL